eukprot:SAG25_NODE_2041_length_2005_cov_1.134837_2_plen_246_part_00
MGTRLYFNFHPDAVHTDALFMQQIDLVVRDLGDRCKLNATPSPVSEGVPPVLTPARTQAPQARALAPVPAPTPIPSPAPASARSSCAPVASTSSDFAPVPMIHQRDVDDASLVHVLLQGQEKIRQEAKAEMQKQEAKFEKKLLDMREEAKVERAEMEAKLESKLAEQKAQMDAKRIEQQLPALQSRVEAMHAADLLSDDELFSIEDVIADLGLASDDTRLGQLIMLSSRLVGDAALSRQIRRKIL